MRLRDPKAGTVVHVAEDQAARYQARGWVDADKPVEKPEPEKTVTEPRRRGRPPKTTK